jgi:phospho-N-acetylmuramoyl-pentapeptide-transferase
MLYHLLLSFQDQFSFLRVVQYISFRIFMAILTAIFLGLMLGRPLIRYLRKMQNGADNIRQDVPERHREKLGTPTMGGIIIILTTLLSFLCWADLNGLLPWVCIITMMGFALIGYADDISKVKKRGGLRARTKFFLQCLLATAMGFLLYDSGFNTSLTIPFLKNANVWMGAAFIPFVALVLVASSNAVNLTDGLDGLAIGPTLIASVTYLFFSYIAGNAFFSDYLQVTYIPGAGEIAILCAALFGGALSFLWYNAYPAQVFMGDVGSLSIGGLLGIIAVVAKQELVLIMVGGIFVLEASSVIIQVISFKLTGKRVFRMAPLHHHFELKGWAEPKVIVRFWIISIILALLSLSTLKLR